MRKVVVTTRQVYHKVAKVEVDVPSHINDEDVRDWLWDNEYLFLDELDDQLSEAKYRHSRGLNSVFDDDSSDTETKYIVSDSEGDIIIIDHC